MNCKQIFGIQFRKARKDLGLSQEEVAEALGGLSRSVISSWESGNSSPLMERLDDISMVLKKPIHFFFYSIDNDRSYGIGVEEWGSVVTSSLKRIFEALNQESEILKKANFKVVYPTVTNSSTSNVASAS